MKTDAKKSDKPPSLTDLEGWKSLAAANGLQRLRPEDIVSAIQHIGPNGDQKLLSDLVCHISDLLLRIIRRRVSKNHRNGGEDIIWRAHHKLIVAMLKPSSSNGKALRDAFRTCVEHRIAEAIRTESVYNHRYQPYATKLVVGENGGEVEETIEPPDNKAIDHVEQTTHVERLLSRISDSRKQEAFRLHMEGCPIESGKGTTSISQQLGVSAKTAGAWIAEVQEFLKIEIGASDE